MNAVFPARAGMSRQLRMLGNGVVRFPRTRGDEPMAKAVEGAALRFSPHARG